MEPDGGLQHPMQCEWRAAEEMVCCLCSMQADHEEDGSRQREAATEPSLLDRRDETAARSAERLDAAGINGPSAGPSVPKCGTGQAQAS